MSNHLDARKRWLALYVLCTGVLMIVLDTTIVTVALPSLQADLQFSGSSLTWVLNAYLLTFGGFLLLGGRLGDLPPTESVLSALQKAEVLERVEKHTTQVRFEPRDSDGISQRQPGVWNLLEHAA